jgi:hypothetical protein
MGSNFDKLSYLAYLMEYSCLKTLASKHKCGMSKIRAMFKDGNGKWGIPYETKSGTKRRYFAKYTECKGASNPVDTVNNLAVVYGYSIKHDRSINHLRSLIAKLGADIAEKNLDLSIMIRRYDETRQY